MFTTISKLKKDGYKVKHDGNLIIATKDGCLNVLSGYPSESFTDEQGEKMYHVYAM